MKIIVLGAGAWGTAIAMTAAVHPAAHHITLWARDPAQAHAMQAVRANTRYLPGAPFPARLHIASSDPTALLAHAELIILGTPTAALRDMLTLVRHCSAPVAWLCKGFEGQHQGTGLLAHEVCAQAAPHLQAGTLSGPSFALEVARNQPTALVAASEHASVRQALVQAFHSPHLRVYANDDLVGVEVGGAVKNVLAIATGLCDGLQLGLNARAALITRGLAEMTRLGLALGARTETFMGLSGLGDLVLTATGDLSRNRRIGLLLAQGHSVDNAVTSLGHVAEGVYSARTVVARARALGIEMPLSEAVVDLLAGRLQAPDALQRLMERDPKGE